MYSGVTYLRGIVFGLLMLCFFYAPVSGASIPRGDLRLELSLMTGAIDTSGNNRPISLTGSAPTYTTDSAYGTPYAEFASGGLRVNTAWMVDGSNNFSFSFWMKLPETNLVNNGTGSTNLSNGVTVSTPNGNTLMYASYYEKPMVIFSAKNTALDTSGLRFAMLKDGTCSFNGEDRKSGSFVCPPQGGSCPLKGSYNDFYTNQAGAFNCNILKDGRWHHILITRKSGALKLFVDGVSFWSGTFGGGIGRTITVGGMGFYPNTAGVYSVYPVPVVNDVFQSSYYRGGMLGFREYSVALSSTDIEALYDEYRYLRESIVATGGIALSLGGYVKPDLTVNISGIPPTLSKENVQYEYAFGSGGAFSPLTDITDISTASGSYSYQAKIDLSSTPDGRITIYFRTRSGSALQALGSVAFMRVDTDPTITINTPSSDLTTSKYISASASDGGALSYALTRGSICDSTLTFETYNDLVFTLLADNGIRICYRAVYDNLGKTIYKLSPIIQGIQPTESSNTSQSSDLFVDYKLWAKSMYQKANDSTMMMLGLVGTPSISTSSQGNTTSYGNGITMTDINGDGLVDFLYSLASPARRAIIVNNGNYTFKSVYKCAIDSSGNPATYTYYGDCADTTR